MHPRPAGSLHDIPTPTLHNRHPNVAQPAQTLSIIYQFSMSMVLMNLLVGMMCSSMTQVRGAGTNAAVGPSRACRQLPGEGRWGREFERVERR